jgi:hypothetical protein
MQALVGDMFREQVQSMTRSPERIEPELIFVNRRIESPQNIYDEAYPIVPKIEPEPLAIPQTKTRMKTPPQKFREIRTKRVLLSPESSLEKPRKPSTTLNIKSEYEQAVEFLIKVNEQDWSSIDPDTHRESVCKQT